MLEPTLRSSCQLSCINLLHSGDVVSSHRHSDTNSERNSSLQASYNNLMPKMQETKKNLNIIYLNKNKLKLAPSFRF